MTHELCDEGVVIECYGYKGKSYGHTIPGQSTAYFTVLYELSLKQATQDLASILYWPHIPEDT